MQNIPKPRQIENEIMYFERADSRACNKALFFTWLLQTLENTFSKFKCILAHNGKYPGTLQDSGKPLKDKPFSTVCVWKWFRTVAIHTETGHQRRLLNSFINSVCLLKVLSQIEY